MAAEATRVLHEWRRAERLLTVLPPDAPERSEIELTLEDMRRLYQHITDEMKPATTQRIEVAERLIERAHILLERVLERYESERADVTHSTAD